VAIGALEEVKGVGLGVVTQKKNWGGLRAATTEEGKERRKKMGKHLLSMKTFISNGERRKEY